MWLPRAVLFGQRFNPSSHSDECLLLLVAFSSLLLFFGRRSSRSWLDLRVAAGFSRSAAATTAALHFATAVRATAVALLLFAAAALGFATTSWLATGLATAMATTAAMAA